MPTLVQRLRDVEAALEGKARYYDLGAAVIREATGDPVLVAGGRWDRIARRFLDPQTEGDADAYAELLCAESQIEFLSWYAEWLCDYREGFPRSVSLAMLADDRRGGKTVAGNMAIAMGCIDVPISPITRTPTIAAIVAKSYRERFEIEEWLLNRIPASFYRHLGQPEHKFLFRTGAILRLLSADDPDAIKQGRFDLIFFNEPQKMSPRAVANGVMATADLGGLAILAANPPGRGDSRGEWLFDLKDALDDEAVAIAKGAKVEPLGVRHFFCPSSKNQFINQAARRRAGRIAAIIDPTIAAGDERGEWERIKDPAAWEFNRHRHLHAIPDVHPSLPDITAEVCSARGEYGRWTTVAGVDFDWKPHIVAVVYRIFGDPDDPLFWACDEFAGEKRWTTKEWIQAFADWGADRGINAQSTLLIGDASSGFNRPGDPKSDGEHTSFEIIQAENWTIIPPQDHRGRSKEGRARNPLVDQRLEVYNEQLRRDRLYIDPKRCVWFAECNRKATTKREGPRRKLVHDQYAHAMDAGTYPIFRLAPRASGAPLDPKDVKIVPVSRRRPSW